MTMQHIDCRNLKEEVSCIHPQLVTYKSSLLRSSFQRIKSSFPYPQNLIYYPPRHLSKALFDTIWKPIAPFIGLLQKLEILQCMYKGFITKVVKK